MAIHDVARYLTKDLMIQTLKQLSSISEGLTTQDLDQLVDAKLSNFSNIVYKANNDMGLCQMRLADALTCYDDDNTATESDCLTLAHDDTLSREILYKLSHGFASMLSKPLYEIRSALPKEAKSLRDTIIAQVPEDNQPNKTTLFAEFNWGKLNHPQMRNIVMIMAQDLLPCFKRSTPQAYDTEQILSYVATSRIEKFTTTPAMIDYLKIELSKAAGLTSKNPVESASLQIIAQSVIDLITKPNNYHRWIISTTSMLNSNQVASHLKDVTESVDTMEAVVLLLSNTIMSKLPDSSELVTTTLVNNVQRMLRDIQLLRASMLYYKEHAFLDRLILTDNVVQSSVLKSFTDEGGTRTMIDDYMAYMVIQDQGGIPGHGVLAKTVSDMHPKVSKFVANKREQLERLKQASYATALQNATVYSLDLHNRKQENTHYGSASMDRKERHVNYRNRALSMMNKHPLEDVAFEYLIAMRNDDFLSSFHRKVHQEVCALAQGSTNITKKDVAQAFCNGVVEFLLNKIVSDYTNPVTVS